jgi:hypothetical protein
MNLKIKNVILLFNLLFLINNTSFSQIACKTLFTPADYTYAQNRTQIILSQLPQDSVISLPQINKTLSIAIHIVKDSLGEVNVDTADIYAEINNTNNLFKPISLSFKVCSVDSIDNFQYDDLIYNSFTTVYEEQQIVNQFYVDSLINIYVITSSNPASVGKSHDNYIIVCKDYLYTIPHLMGHVFGLLHTNGNGDHAELVDGSNCLSAGDFVCDTEADPEFDPVSSSLWYYEINCELASSPYSYPLKDPNDDWYKIPSYNYMSLYSNCWCQLTPFQYQIIAYEYYLHKTYLR